MNLTTYILLRKLKYFSGETIRGQVIVDNQTGNSQRLKERIYILFHGYSTTNLRGRKVTNEQSAIVATTRRNSVGTEIYLQTAVYLTPEDSSGVELEPGHNGFPFQFELPSYLPSSFFGSMGIVEYEAKTTIYVAGAPTRHPGYTDTLKFRVTNCQDLNLSDLAGRHCYFSFEKMVPAPIKSGSFKKAVSRHPHYGLLTAEVKLSSQAFVPGETIPLTIQITNLTGNGIERVQVQFIRETYYACPAGSAMDSEVLNSWTEAHPRFAEQGKLHTRLDVPPSALPTSEIIALISMKYALMINVKMDSTVVSVGKIPIFIGNIALRPFENRSGSSRDRHQVPGLQQLELEGAVGGEIPELLLHHPSAPSLQEIGGTEQEFPPSYSEAIAMPASPSHQSTTYEEYL